MSTSNKLKLSGQYKQEGADVPVAIFQQNGVLLLTNYKGQVAVGQLKNHDLEILSGSAWGAGFKATVRHSKGHYSVSWDNGAIWTRVTTEFDE